MDNRTVEVFRSVFTMGSIALSPEGTYTTVALGVLLFSFTFGCNLVLLLLILTHGSLHQPMYVFLFNLSLNDLLVISAFFPRVLADMLSKERAITVPGCVLQALCLHLYGGATLLIMSLMAFDRYLAVCRPLRYRSIMTAGCAAKLAACAWLLDLLLVGVLFGLTLRHPFCATLLGGFYCDNPSLLRLTCAADTLANNIYGLFITGVFHAVGLASVTFSYAFILLACLKNPECRAKAVHTCATHLLVFLVYEFSGLIIVLVYRIRDSPPNLHKFMSMSFFLVPTSLNPIIYGVRTKEVQVKLKQMFHKRIFDFQINKSLSNKKVGHGMNSP